MTAPTPKLAYTIKEAAYSIGISEATIERNIKAGNLAAKKLGGRILIPAAELAAWIDTQEAAQ